MGVYCIYSLTLLVCAFVFGAGLTLVYCSATFAGCPLPRKGCFTIRLFRITISSSPADLLLSNC